MTVALRELGQALAGFVPLTLPQALRLADQLFAPLNALAATITALVDAPFIGVALVPLLVVFEVIGGLLAALVVAGLLVGSALLAVACADLAAAIARAAVLLALVHRALGGG